MKIDFKSRPYFKTPQYLRTTACLMLFWSKSSVPSAYCKLMRDVFRRPPMSPPFSMQLSMQLRLSAIRTNNSGDKGSPVAVHACKLFPWWPPY